MVLDRRLLDDDINRRQPVSDLADPLVVAEGRQGGGHGFVEGRGGHLYGVLDALQVRYRYCAEPRPTCYLFRLMFAHSKICLPGLVTKRRTLVLLFSSLWLCRQARSASSPIRLQRTVENAKIRDHILVQYKNLSSTKS